MADSEGSLPPLVLQHAALLVYSPGVGCHCAHRCRASWRRCKAAQAFRAEGGDTAAAAADTLAAALKGKLACRPSLECHHEASLIVVAAV